MQEQEKYQLHLPQTAFPMKAKLLEKEPLLIKFWQEKRIYPALIDKKKNCSSINFIDGPPYANGNLHIGHALNKILKDIAVKYFNISGKKCLFTPVWDCHGLPIELAVLKKQKNTSKMTATEIRKQCRNTALYWVEEQKTQFQRLGVLADWEKPLLTMSSEYEADEILALAEIVEKDLLYRGEKPVHWCYKLQTAVATSEVEYREHKSPSIYVKFPFCSVPEKWGLTDKKCFMVIWTTTPWTLPANQAICLHPDFLYGVFDTGSEYLILAEDLQMMFEKSCDLKLKKKFSIRGRDLENHKARHPFLDQDSLIILGHHVTKEEGTGCVHTAPGHGVDDFLIGKKYGLKTLCPVDEKGCFTDFVPEKWQGMNVFKANHFIIETLKEKSFLLAFKEIKHNYPFNPRSFSPLIFRAVPQWFISFDHPSYSIRKSALSKINEIQFYPDWGKKRLTAMIQNSPDWCLSRQRHWGVPIPVFYCKKCSFVLVDPVIMKDISVKMRKSQLGMEYWFTRSAKELLPEGCSCPKCQSTEWEKGKDILDVWFDSGLCHYVFKNKYGSQTFPSHFYLEGSDQHRGWFQTSLNTALALEEQAPFKTLVTHCFVNDAKGYKMSKSKGNVINLEKIIKQKGAEILRLWAASEDYSQDLQIGEEIFQRVSETYRRFRNTIRFMLGNLSDFHPQKDLVPFDSMKEIDQWILGSLSNLIQKTKVHYEEFAFHKIYQDLNIFFTKSLSNLYLDLLKDRLYTFQKTGRDRRSGQSAIYLLLKNLLSLMSPITAFLSEEAYQHLPGDKQKSVLLSDFPTPLPEWTQPQLDKKIKCLLQIREELLSQIELMRKAKQIGSSLEIQVILFLSKNLLTELKPVEEDLRELFIVSQVKIKLIENIKNDSQFQSFTRAQTDVAPIGEWKIIVKKAEGEKCARCWNYSITLNSKKICLKCQRNL